MGVPAGVMGWLENTPIHSRPVKTRSRSASDLMVVRNSIFDLRSLDFSSAV